MSDLYWGLTKEELDDFCSCWKYYDYDCENKEYYSYLTKIKNNYPEYNEDMIYEIYEYFPDLRKNIHK